MINDYFDKLFVIKRNSWLEDNEGNSYSILAEISQFMGHLQQADARLLQSLGLTLTNSYSIWCPFDTGILAGDILMSSYGNFSVKAIQKFDIGNNKHIQIVAQLDETVGS
jgi:hypothetical protein